MPKQIVHEGATYEAVADIRLTPHGEDNMAIVHVRDQDGDTQVKKTLYVGVFFDGTGQNMFVDEQRADSDISNIAKLYRAYQEGNALDGRDQTYQRIYQRGVGTINPGDTLDESQESLIGLALGIGSEGGHARIKDTLARLNRIPNLHSYEDIVFDVFGFSRGASLARHFTNLVNAWPSRIHIPYLPTGNYSLLRPGILNLIGFESVRAFPQREELRGRVRFLGLFDTVGSFYLPGNDNNLDFNLNLKSDSAEQVVQFTAHHEIRHNFPLTSLRSASGELPGNLHEEALPGVHADVGGGYPNPYEATYHTDAWQTRIIQRHNGLGLSPEAIRIKQTEAESQGHYIRVVGADIYVEDRLPIFHELSYWTLKRMVEHIKRADLPFKSIYFDPGEVASHEDPDEEYYIYLIPEELNKAIEQWQASGGHLEASKDYLENYIHVSHAKWSITHRPTSNNLRNVFFNNPG